MSLEGYKPTAEQKRRILAGFAVVEKYARSDFELNQNVRLEANGYGRTSDRVPRIAAQALIVKWFLDGVNEPNMPARYIWNCRPAAIWAIGNGLTYANRLTPEDRATLKTAAAAHEEAFDAMLRSR